MNVFTGSYIWEKTIIFANIPTKGSMSLGRNHHYSALNDWDSALLLLYFLSLWIYQLRLNAALIFLFQILILAIFYLQYMLWLLPLTI